MAVLVRSKSWSNDMYTVGVCSIGCTLWVCAPQAGVELNPPRSTGTLLAKAPEFLVTQQ